MNFAQLRTLIQTGYTRATKTVMLDLSQFDMDNFSNFLIETSGSSKLLIQVEDDIDFSTGNKELNIVGETAIWNGISREVRIRFTDDAPSPSSHFVFQVLPKKLDLIFPVFNQRTFQRLPFIENQPAEISFSSNEQNSDELCFKLKVPIDVKSAQLVFFSSILGIDDNSEFIGTLIRSRENQSFTMNLSPIHEISMLNAQFQISSRIELQGSNNPFSSEFSTDENDLELDTLNFDDDFDWLEETDDSADTTETTGIIITTRVNNQLSFNAILSSLRPRLVHFETSNEFNLLDVSSFDWLLGDHDLTSFLPESISQNVELTIKNSRLSIDVRKLAIVSAELKVEIAGHAPIQIIPDHLELEKVDVSFFINAPFGSNNFSVTATTDFSFEQAKFAVSATFPELNFRFDLLRDSKFTFQNLNAFLPFSFPEIPNMSISQFFFSGGVKDNSTIRLHARLDDVWSLPVGTSSFDLNYIDFSYRRDQTFSSSRAMGMMHIFDLPFLISATHISQNKGLYLEGRIPNDESIHINDLIDRIGTLFHFPAPTHLPDLTINELLIGFDTHTKDFRFRAAGELHEEMGPIKKGKVSLELNLTHDEEKNAHKFQLKLGGEIEIAHTELRFSVDVGHPNWSVSANWVKGEGDSLKLLDLVQLFNKDETFSNVDPEIQRVLSLSQIGLSYHNESKMFQASMSTDGGESIVIAGGKPNNEWGFLFGIGYDEVNNIPLLGSHLENTTEKIHLENVWFIYNGFGNEQELPELPEPFSHVINSESLSDNVMVLATLDMDKNQHNSDLHLIKEHVTKSTLSVYAGLSVKGENKGITLRAELDGNIEIPLNDEKTGEKDNALVLEDCFIQFDYHNSIFELMLGGTMHFVLDHLHLSPTIRLVVSTHGLEAMVDLKFGDGIHDGWHPFGIEGLTINEVGLLLGIDFETSGIEFGLQGKMSLTENGTTTVTRTETPFENHIEFGIVLEMIGEIPNPEFFALSIQRIDFSQLAQLFIGSSKEGHNAVTSTLKGENLSIYWAEKVLTLPDGTKTNPLFGLHGEFDIFGWKAYAHLDVHTDSGISGDAQTDKIEWGVFELTGDGEELIRLIDAKGQPISNARLPFKSNSNPAETPQNATSEVIVHAGGPVIHFNSTTSPFLHASIHAKLLGFIQADLDATITDKGFNFNVHFEIKHLADFRLTCSLDNGTTFDAAGNFFVGINQPIETVFGVTEFELGAYANMHLHIDGTKPKDFQLSLNGGLDVMGLEIPFVSVDIQGFPTHAEAIPLWLASQFTKDVFPPLHELFEKAYNEIESGPEPYNADKQKQAIALLDFAEQWADFVDDDLDELNNQQHISAKMAEHLTGVIDKQTEKIRHNLSEIQSKNATIHSDESARLQLQAAQVVEKAKQIRESSAENRRIIISNQEREIRELLDENNVIRTKIEKIWEEFRSKTNGKTPTEAHEALRTFEAEIQNRLDSLKLPVPIEHLKAHETNQQTHRRNVIDDEYNHYLNVDAKYELYSTIEGKFTPRAIDHHATIIGGRITSEVMIAAILWEAQEQAKTIIERTQNEMNTFSNAL